MDRDGRIIKISMLCGAAQQRDTWSVTKLWEQSKHFIAMIVSRYIQEASRPATGTGLEL